MRPPVRLVTGVIAYYRTSTSRQRLSPQAQREAVQRFVVNEGMQLIDEMTEVETGKGADALERRPVLRKALTQARKAGAAVVVAKLDRLSRDVAFISGLMAQKVPFIVPGMTMSLSTRSKMWRSRSSSARWASLAVCTT